MCSCNFLLAIIDDILDLSKLELNQFNLNMQWFSLSEIIRDVVSIMEVQAKMKNVKIHIQIEDSVVDLIFSDSKRLRQILFNLMGNAIKFTVQGSITIRVDMNPFFILNDDPIKTSLYFKVIDTGIGIKEEDRAKLFKLFGKLSVRGGLNQNGVGLGLTICKRLVEQLGGNITFKSDYGKGTTFKFNVECQVKSEKPSQVERFKDSFFNAAEDESCHISQTIPAFTEICQLTERRSFKN